MSDGIIVGSAVEEYERICSGGPSITFCVDTAHSKLVAEAFGRHGYRTEHVDGETPRRERRDLIAALADGSLSGSRGHDLEVAAERKSAATDKTRAERRCMAERSY
jgi:hypothetical protein